MTVSSAPEFEISILKPLWTRHPDGRWGIHGAKGIKLAPKSGQQSDFFSCEHEVDLLTTSPPKNIGDLFSSFGTTDFFLKQSIMPVVLWEKGAPLIRCIGTAFVISCSGYVITAAHVLTEPRERGYGKIERLADNVERNDGVFMGVILPLAPMTGVRGFKLVPFQHAWYWGEWIESPVIGQKENFQGLTDVAVCKLPPTKDGSAYQPMNLSLHPFSKGEVAYAIGYAEMDDIQVIYRDGQAVVPEFDTEVFVSVGEVIELFADNHISRAVPAPGPSFDFRARIPGKMSGAPIFGAKGAIVRGVVSRSFSGEKHAFGSMLGPALWAPLTDGTSLKQKMDSQKEGMAVVMGQGL